MNLITRRIKGMQDLLPIDSYKIENIEKVMKEEAKLYGFKLIRTPVLEHTELFERSVGDTSDVVQKEMYTFEDKGGRSVSLRPEGTAGAIRLVLENGLHNKSLPVKVMYIASCYRYEKPQSGRYREFFQFGLEVFGAESSASDAELICAAYSILKRLQIKNLKLEINSIGCKECRKKYNDAIKEYFGNYQSELCDDCKNRLSRNPMRIMDCKNQKCREISSKAPIITDYICGECSEHFEELKSYLNSQNIEYSVNLKIVRGLDYYSKTVFEFICDLDGAPLTICGGGRYDGLSEIIGGPKFPAIGFGMGIERIFAVMEAQNIEFPEPSVPKVFISSLNDEKAKLKAFELCEKLRRVSIYAQVDVMERTVKSQMKYADKIGSLYSMVIGEEEVNSGIAKIKEMKSGKETNINIGEDFVNEFMELELKKYIG